MKPCSRAILAFVFLACVLSANAQNCVLTIPNNPLTATGLATPFKVTGCSQAGIGTFAHGAILNIDTGAISIYNPLVVDATTAVTQPPIVPTLPTNFVAALWFATNGQSLTLQGGANTLLTANCVNGAPGGTIFGTYAACNAQAFFDAANVAIGLGKITVPPLGTDLNGNTCPTSRDFGIVNARPSDGVPTTYILGTTDNTIAQNTPANLAAYKAKGPKTLANGIGSAALQNLLLAPTIGCTSWTAPDLADSNVKAPQQLPSVALNELQARLTAVPAAFVPVNDPLVLTAGATDIAKINAIRATINQTPITSLLQAKTLSYCQNLYRVGAVKIVTWLPKAQAVAVNVGGTTNLASYLVSRFNTAVGPAAAGGLGCTTLIGPSPLANLVNAQNTLQQNAVAAFNIRDMNQLAAQLAVNNVQVALDTQVGEATTNNAAAAPPAGGGAAGTGGGGVAGMSTIIAIGAAGSALGILVVICYYGRRSCSSLKATAGSA